jgi:hypothetical protein
MNSERFDMSSVFDRELNEAIVIADISNSYYHRTEATKQRSGS